MSGFRFSNTSYSWGARKTGVACPSCDDGELEIRFSCLSSLFSCSGCRTPFLLADLVHQLDEAQFETLTSLVGDRLSDRVG